MSCFLSSSIAFMIFFNTRSCFDNNAISLIITGHENRNNLGLTGLELFFGVVLLRVLYPTGY